ncbi:hypothetical protein TREMEDRAFT_68366 [Tremella mesenterica DSM 1558]|uniref:uncharacterized protein n=1 Tax=Tremella mesenterica (strain ATCC 24925 / CBS 8224 / DSM 1558 / NBRC 9311 / NRRL Y-6157 / RJB 2259-6 / UBC 559-6) TaxID=578456 RepID=UPI0003F4A300|nr:uncharacterized protein TREMEDRAFT_68366 [Tremella mesenterica DSM 1558]EIW69915.1 hypothetical protein TREMEDRAFT_68366 [Tremella mesenterica DSM 1558]
MHDQSMVSTPGQPPPVWRENTRYTIGMVVHSQGTWWRCEQDHFGGNLSESLPSLNLHLWTPIGSSHLSQFSNLNTPAQIISPTPEIVSSHHPAHHLESQLPFTQYAESSSNNNIKMASELHSDPSASSSSGSGISPGESRSESNSSGETVRPTASSSIDEDRRQMNTDRAFLASRASESLRYLILREEEHQAEEEEGLKNELEGRKVWRVGGIGVWAYSIIERVELRKRNLFRLSGETGGKDEWYKAALARTEFYKNTTGVKPLVMWKLVERGEHLPNDALPVGREENGQILYTARAWWEGGVHPGPGIHLVDSASISYAGSEHSLDVYEVLCGPADPDIIKWMSFDHGQRATVDGWQPVEGGRERDGRALLVARGEYESGQHPGKCLVDDDHACVGYGGGELWVRPFQVLAYASASRR